MQIALHKLCGVRENWEPQLSSGGLINWKPKGDGKFDAGIPAFRGVQEAYIAFTGDREMRWGGDTVRAQEEWNAAGFANALGNTLYRRMIQDYMEVDYGIDMVCPPREPHRVALKDFRTHEIIRVGYLGDLSLNDPESSDWPEISAPTDEKATLAAVQFGNLLTVTRRTIINDDLGLVAKIASRIGRAARRTLARRLWNLVINNPAIYDSVTFFHATSHGANLGTTALSAAELSVIRKAMRKQTEKDSGEQLGIGPYILVVPIDLEGTAITVNEQEFTDSSFTPNPVRYMFGKTDAPNGLQGISGTKPARIIVNPLFTDATDYAVFANPDEIQTFEMGFLQGKAEPELLLADNQLVGKAFTSDRIQYKVRHEYEITVVDYRGAYKEVVAG